MSRWFRLDDDVINDPKILKLSDKLHRVWIGILCIASKNDGQLPSIDDMALMIRMKAGKLEEAIKSLIKSGLIDEDGPIRSPHNWGKRQFKSDVSTERVKRFRKQERNVSETPPHTETQTHTQPEKKETREAALSDEPSDFDAFWDEWPNKVGKPAALKAFNSAIKRGAGLWDIQDGLRNYIRDKPPDRSWLNPATFLNQNRWEDQPATVQGSSNGRRTVQQAADDLLEKLRAFDEPAPSNLCDGTGENAVRLLSSR